MRNFSFYSPTKVVFGKGAEGQVGSLLGEYACKRVMLHYGGGSAAKSGLLGRIEESVRAAGMACIPFGGAQPNPRLSKVNEGVALAKAEGVDFILAVGGGSVIDSAKAIAYGLRAEGDLWDFFTGKAEATGACPFGCVLTIAAAGSEMGGGCVITNENGWLKRGYTSPFGFNKFAVMNPELTYTLPAYQTFCGCTDILIHTLERYFHAGGTLELTDRIAESLLRTVMEAARALLQNPRDYQARAEIMWAGGLSHNGLTGCGGGQGSWVPHKLQNELGGMFDVAHGASLAALWGSWARYIFGAHPERFVKLATRVLGVEESGGPQETARRGIAQMEAFFREIGMPTNLRELGLDVTEAQISEMADKCTNNGSVTWGDIQKLGREDVAAIYRAARG